MKLAEELGHLSAEVDDEENTSIENDASILWESIEHAMRVRARNGYIDYTWHLDKGLPRKVTAEIVLRFMEDCFVITRTAALDTFLISW